MTDQQTFDLGSYLGEQARAVVNKVNPDGSAQITLPDGSTKQFDTNSFLKDHGIDPTKMKVQYNSPEQALPDNPIGFKDGIELASHSAKGQRMFLEQKFGTDNVQVNPSGGFLVNDKGTWKQADPKFLARLTAVTPEVGGGVIGGMTGAGVGAAIGGGIGSLIAPGPGTVVGMAIGGGIGEWVGSSAGAALATVAKEQGVDALNLHTQVDTEEAKKVFKQEFANNMVWGGIFSTLRLGGKVAKPLVQDFFNPAVDKVALSELMSKRVGGPQSDWMTVIRSGDDAKAVLENNKIESAWKDAYANGKVQGLSPLTKRTERTVVEFMDRAETAAQQKMGDGLKAVDKAGLMDNKVDMSEAVGDLKTKLAKLGILGYDENKKMIISMNPKDATAEHLPKVWDEKSISAFQNILDLVQNPKVLDVENKMSFRNASGFQRSISALMDKTGAFDGSNLSRETRAALQSFRFNVGKSMGESLDGKVVEMVGELKDAAPFWKKLNYDYSKYREYADNFSKPSQLGGDAQQITTAVNRMLGPKGQAMEQSFGDMAGAVGIDASQTLKQLQQMRAAQNLSDKIPNQQASSLSQMVVNRFRGSQATNVQRLANKTINTEEMAKAYQDGILAKIPASPSGKTAVGALARSVDFLNKIPPADKMKLLTSPMALRALDKATFEADANHQEIVGQFMSQFLGNQNQQ